MFRLLLSISWLLIAAGCATLTPALDLSFSERTPSRRALIQYRQQPASPAIHGEAIVRFEAPSKFQLLAWKGPVSWIGAQMNAEQWRVEFPTQQRVVSGDSRNPPPVSLSVWLAVRDEIAAQPAARQIKIAGRDGSTLQLRFTDNP